MTSNISRKKSIRTGKIIEVDFWAEERLRLRRNALIAEEKALNIFLTIENCVLDVTKQKETSNVKKLSGKRKNFEL